MKLYDTRQSKNLLVTGNSVKVYGCGPTLYYFAHIGNLRSYVFQDLLCRAMRFEGYKVFHVVNFTDVDDKTIQGAKLAGLPLKKFTTYYKDAFFNDLDTLNVVRADIYPFATDYIDHMVVLVEKLIKKGYAYVTESDVRFKIEKFPNYGKLSGKVVDRKSGDFTLWKGYNQERDGNVYWDSPWGRGRPGWHLECSAMALKILGSVDIHIGGIDLVFPHHENEIAQSEAATGELFVKHWVHNGHLLVDGKKMSKSEGNLYLLKDILDMGYTSREIRAFFIGTHYGKNLNFTFDALKKVREYLYKLDNFVNRLQSIYKEGEPLFVDKIKKMKIDFGKALTNNLNVAECWSVIFDFLRIANHWMDKGNMVVSDAKLTVETLKEIDTVFGFIFFNNSSNLDDDLIFALKERDLAREKKDWKLADEKRSYINSRGYKIEDSKSGSFLRKI